MLGLMELILIVGLYFFPTINAYHAKHKNKDAVFGVNLFFGWTIVGWIIALIWSTTKKD